MTHPCPAPGRRVSRLVLAAGLMTALLGPANSAQALSTESVMVPTTTEAWYRTTPICDQPAGCPTTPPSPYAPDTLHIGVNLGQEEARTALQLDLAALPADTGPVGGQLVLPVADGPRDGSRMLSDAAMRACVVTQPVAAADGAFAAGPAVDCDAGSAEATFVAATEDAPARFIVDLAALTRAWANSPVPGGLALVPSEELSATATWHVALSRRDRTGEATGPVTATIVYVSGTTDTTDGPDGQAPPPAAEPAPGPTGQAGLTVDVEDPADQGATPPAPEVAPDPVPAAAPPPAPSATPLVMGYEYPAVFVLPLLLAVAAAWLARAFTRDLALVPLNEHQRSAP